MVYPWDQRQSVFDGMIDPDAKFEGVSGYNAEFVKKTNSWSRTIPSAGVKCYEGEIGDGPPGQVKRNYARKHFPEKANAETLTDPTGNEGLHDDFSAEGRNCGYFYRDENSEVPRSPTRKQTFTVLRDGSNFNQNQESSEVLLRDQFADMELQPSVKQEKDDMKVIGRMVVDVDGKESPQRGQNGNSKNYYAQGQPEVVNVSD